jgi:hypothetical protein
MSVLLLSLAACLAAPLAAQPIVSLPLSGEWPLALAQSLFEEAKAPLPAPLWPRDWVLAAYADDLGEPLCPGRFDPDGLAGKPGASVQRDRAGGEVVHFLPCSAPGRVFKDATFAFPLQSATGAVTCRALDAEAAVCRVIMESRLAGQASAPYRRSTHYYGLGRRLGAK